jgi:hypothetical protein
MKKIQKLQVVFMSVICMVFGMAVCMACPMEIRADWEESWCHSYEELQEAAENGQELYVDPDGFTWPSEKVTLTISGDKTIYIDSGSAAWTIPSNVTLELPEINTTEGYVKYPYIKSNSYNQIPELRVEGTVSCYSEHTLSSVSLTVAKGGKITSGNGLYVGEGYTLTVEKGADLTESVRLDGTLTGKGTVSGYITISGGYMGSDTNAVISGNITCTGSVDVRKWSADGYNAALKIPKGSSITMYRLEVDNATVTVAGKLLLADGTGNYHSVQNGGKIVAKSGTLTLAPSVNLQGDRNYDKSGKLVSVTSDVQVATGASYVVGANKYKVISSTEVSFTGLKSSSTKKVTIPKTVTIEGKSFQVTSISAKALKGTKVTSVTIGENVSTIGNSAFENCKSLATITIKSTGLKSVGKKALSGIKGTAKIKVPSSKLKAYKKLLKGKGQGSKVKITK